MKVVFMGTPHFAVPSLEIIAENHDVVGVITAPDRPAGRGKKITESPVKTRARSLGLKILQPTNLKDEQFQKDLNALEADLFVVVAFRMLPKSVWAMPEKGTINLHASLLPQYRGAAPINWAVINGEKETGLTTFYIEEKIDTGKIIRQSKLAIGETETAGDLHDRMMQIGAQLLKETLDDIENDSVNPIDQTTETHTLKPAPKIFKEDCLIDWNKSRQEIYNMIRGLSPYPAAWTYISINESEASTLKIYSASISGNAKQTSGSGKAIIEDEKIFVQCGDGLLELNEVQLAGKKRMEASDFLRGQHNLDSIHFSPANPSNRD
jgi:methionyl-tRNA formyltransferase